MILLAAALSLFADVRTPDPVIAGFHLETQPPEPPAPPVLAPKEPLLFRLLGYGNYAGAGAYSASSLYREERTQGFWDPTIENVYARVGTAAAAAEASNMMASMLYRSGNQAQAWMLRIGSVVAYGFMTGRNFNQGWHRE